MVFCHESYAPVILQRRATTRRFETKNWAIHAPADEHRANLQEIVTKYLFRPWKMLILEPILLLITLYMSSSTVGHPSPVLLQRQMLIPFPQAFSTFLLLLPNIFPRNSRLECRHCCSPLLVHLDRCGNRRRHHHLHLSNSLQAQIA